MAAVMDNANTLRKTLNTGSGVSYGAWQMLPGTHLSRAIARAGFDWVCIDCEHGNIAGKLAPISLLRPLSRYTHEKEADRRTLLQYLDDAMHESIHAVASVGVSPVVRIPANEGWMVKRALDAGAHGIIVPLLYTVDDAKRLVQSAKFPPLGKRGFGSPFSQGSFDVKGNLSGIEYLQGANGNLLTAVQIETKEALGCVEEIAKVDGIDVLFVGPFDLGNNIGHPVTGDFPPELDAAIARILKAAQDEGKKSGIYSPSAEFANRYADMGFQMISVVNDMSAIPISMAKSLSKAKGCYGDAAQGPKQAAYSAASLVTQKKK
ncbi:uncharacterized protein PV06_00098 [Exophiala oligosperma]|uniref:HpcH/HpaI aldolase/citrate lyase domain-containing protein n=1 Tax=Exophiala oligosperma TaxID=215243 RepID=A0A0D2DXP1_9EURO|nr:uncharacterized protein PV06_00098 [Exophiala oligosperma]KIW47400.1 hypothetical protein PV06_00098 [Exophiala oligosperma]